MLGFFCGFLLQLASICNAQQAISVFAQQADMRQLHQSIEALGTLRANESTSLSATVTETVTSIHFSDNQRVKRGDILVQMTSAEEQAQLEEAESAHAEARRQLQRLRTLMNKNLASESLIDQQQGVVDAAVSQLKAVRSRLHDRLIIAPFDGVVGLRNFSVGTLVRPGEVLTSLDDTSVMKLDITVPSVHLNKLEVGMELTASAPALPQQTFTGRLASIGSRVDPVTRSVTARAIIANPDGTLRPGLSMIVKLKSAGRHALVLPEEAVIQVGRKAHVFVIKRDAEPNTVVKREVELGLRQASQVEIAAGLSAGEWVVIHGGLKLRTGAQVTVTAVPENTKTEQLLAR